MSYLRKTQAGELVYDKCATDAEHLAAETPEGSDRRNCRVVLAEMLAPILNVAGSVDMKFYGCTIDGSLAYRFEILFIPRPNDLAEPAPSTR